MDNTNALKAQQDINEAKMNIEVAKVGMERYEALKRLEQNTDFKSLILNEYLHDEPLRLVKALGNPQAINQTFRDNLVKQMEAIANFQGMLDMTKNFGQNAPHMLLENEEVLEQLMQDK